MVGDQINEELQDKGWVLLKDLIDNNNENVEMPLLLQTPSKQSMQIFFTSGTTGSPKMCALNHRFQTFTSLKAELYQDINGGFELSGCLN